MARQYGNQTGAFRDPTSSVAKGSWVAPTEAVRNKTLSRWPSPQVGVPPIFTGTYVYSLASGITDTLVAEGSYYVADGSAKSRSSDSNLFAVLNTTYGSGNGSTTFNIPNISSKPYTYLKTTTVSGLTLTSLSGVGVLPGHTHTVTGTVGTQNGNTTGNTQSGVRGSAFDNTIFTSFDGDSDGNAPRRREAQVLIARNTETAPVGVVIPALLPLNQLDFNNQLSSAFLIPSGQTVSRTQYSTLFSYIGVKFGVGDGINTFTLPDLRGLFLSGYPTSIPDSSGVLPSGYLVDSFARHRHLANLYSPNKLGGFNSNAINAGNTIAAPATGNSSLTGTETRPANISVVWLLVAQ